MAETARLFMDPDTYASEPRERLAAYLERKFPARDGYRYKRMANTFRTTPATAENWVRGHWPQSKHLQRIVRHFGQDVLDAIFGPDIDETLARLRQEEASLEAQLAEKRARRLAAESRLASAAQRVEIPTPVAANVEPIRRRKP
jgi:uncharacterized small protein (DUF1192 family)